MEFSELKETQWSDLKEIYSEAFPILERKPVFVLKRFVKTGKAQIFTATEDDVLLGFAVVIPYEDMALVDYLAVSSKFRGKGTGTFIMQELCKHFQDKKIIIEIEKLDEEAVNTKQRVARRKFYLKNGFKAPHIYTNSSMGDMEILNYGGKVSPKEYLRMQKYLLGDLFYKLSNVTLTRSGEYE